MGKFIKIIVCLLLIATGTLLITGQASAANTANFKAGRIIDDVNFFTPNTMSANDIQNFLNAKVPTCDTNGTQLSSHSNGSGGRYTRAQWGALNGNPAPYICLKNYSQATPSRAAEQGLCNGYNASTQQSAAQIIYNVSSSCGVNPKVLLVLLQKEQGLITDDWPWSVQYRSATGYGCPDTAPCDSEYYGFFNQVYAAARQFKKYARDSSSYSYRAGLNNSIQYNPSASCGSGVVFIQNQATAGLYNYTPYQPNQAALNAGYGSAPPCGAYGNRNFWLYYSDWFGSPINDAYAWELVQNSSDGKIYLIVNNVKHWVPGPAYMTAWGLDKFNYRSVDTNFINNISTGANITYVGLDINGSRFLMSKGVKYWLPNDSYVLLWNAAGISHISAPGLVAQMPDGGSIGRFATDETSGITYLLDGTLKHAGLNAQSLSYWGQSASNTTTVTSDILARMTTGQAVDRYVTTGGKNMIIDQSKALTFKNAAIESAWGSRSYVAINVYASNAIAHASATNFALNAADSRWYYLEAGKKHYVPTSTMAQFWGWGLSNGLTSISDALAGQLTTSTNLSYLAKTAGGNNYVVDGSKHLIGANYAPLWLGGQTPPTFSDQAFSLLPAGSAIQTSIIGFQDNPKIFTTDNGQIRHITKPSALYALGAGRNNPILTLNKSLYGYLSEGASVGSPYLQVTPGTIYALSAGNRYTLDSDSTNSWGATSPATVTSSYLNVLTDSGKTVGDALTINGSKYLVNAQTLLNVSGDYDNYGLTSPDFVSLPESYFPVRQSSSILVGTSGSGKIWLLSMGKRYYIPTPSLLYDLGYGKGFGIVNLSSDIISTLPEQGTIASHLLKSPNSGTIFASLGTGYGFRDSDTLDAYSDGQILTVSGSHFNRFAFVGWTSKLITGTNGKVYALDNGQKRWVMGPSLLNKYYSGVSILYLPQTTVDALPTGTAISS